MKNWSIICPVKISRTCQVCLWLLRKWLNRTVQTWLSLVIIRSNKFSYFLLKPKHLKHIFCSVYSTVLHLLTENPRHHVQFVNLSQYTTQIRSGCFIFTQILKKTNKIRLHTEHEYLTTILWIFGPVLCPVLWKQISSNYRQVLSVGWEAEIQSNLEIPSVGSWRVKSYAVMSSTWCASLVVYTKSFQIQVHRIKHPNPQLHMFLPDSAAIQQLEIRSVLPWFHDAIHVELAGEQMQVLEMQFLMLSILHLSDI